MSEAEFIASFGDIAEHSPWVAERVARDLIRPSATFSKGEGQDLRAVPTSDPSPLEKEAEGRMRSLGHTLQTLTTAFTQAVLNAPEHQQLALLRAHPDLATRAKLTEDSHNEQKGAGLDTLTPDEFVRFTKLNHQYTEQNGFPFIFAVKGATKHQILESFEKRIHNSREEEFQVALEQVCKIIGFRLEARLKQ